MIMKVQNYSLSIAAAQFKRKHPKLVMTVLMLIIIPVAASLILGYEMKADVAVTIPTVVMDSDQSSFSRDYVSYIENSPYFNVIKYTDSYDEMRDMIYKGNAYVGVVIPKNFYKDMKEGNAPKILTVYDGSTLAVIVSSKSSMLEILLTVKAGYMASIYEGKQNVVPTQVKNHVSPLNYTLRVLFNPYKSFRNFILPGMLAAVVQVAIAIIGAERGWENQRRNLSFPGHVMAVFLWSLTGSLSLFLTMSVQWFLFGLPYKGTILGGILITLMFSFCITLLGYIMGSFFDERTFCTQISCILVLPTTILGGYTWPVLGMPPVMQYVAKAIPFTYYSDALRNLCLKPIELHHLHTAFTAVAFVILVELLVLFLVKVIKNKKLARAGVMTA